MCSRSGRAGADARRRKARRVEERRPSISARPSSRSFCWPPDSARASERVEMVEVQETQHLAGAPLGSRRRVAGSVSAGTMRFSRTSCAGTGAAPGTCAPTPLRAKTCAGEPVMATPRSRIVPRSGISAPATMLMCVVLPEPSGPIRPTSSPRASGNGDPSTALMPPKGLHQGHRLERAGGQRPPPRFQPGGARVSGLGAAVSGALRPPRVRAKSTSGAKSPFWANRCTRIRRGRAARSATGRTLALSSEARRRGPPPPRPRQALDAADHGHRHDEAHLRDDHHAGRQDADKVARRRPRRGRRCRCVTMKTMILHNVVSTPRGSARALVLADRPQEEPDARAHEPDHQQQRSDEQDKAQHSSTAAASCRRTGRHLQAEAAARELVLGDQDQPEDHRDRQGEQGEIGAAEPQQSQPIRPRDDRQQQARYMPSTSGKPRCPARAARRRSRPARRTRRARRRTAPHNQRAAPSSRRASRSSKRSRHMESNSRAGPAGKRRRRDQRRPPARRATGCVRDGHAYSSRAWGRPNRPVGRTRSVNTSSRAPNALGVGERLVGIGKKRHAQPLDHAQQDAADDAAAAPSPCRPAR